MGGVGRALLLLAWATAALGCSAQSTDGGRDALAPAASSDAAWGAVDADATDGTLPSGDGQLADANTDGSDDVGLLDQFSGGDGSLNEGAAPCAPKTCQDLGVQCGPADDGCGAVLHCGNCPAGRECSAGGVCGVCLEVCLSCAQQGIGCGFAGDGLGGIVDCGSCPPPQTCGGGGVPNQCGIGDAGSACVPLTCAELAYDCGQAVDGCGGALSCGTCTAPDVCGGGGSHRCGPDDAGSLDGG
jgi:hypothetical protein